ncbi:TIGR02270 family protein [Myxococcus xanthus]|uniref:TIGR02270 family protein n=1 Tax=Myxococcus xanthus TaxID=34 RepID=A0A7Y4MW80_MYXXA|nr:TIGR02270 family protein [Myxococcus xanthus]NOJ83473.1 TIGR02270 family protein [Myxococcus xanthus]NOJ87524.1 TIGR02270 family protein [Myxococcus xanthus]
MAKHTGRLLHWNIYETHLDEAAFRWTQWEQALDAPDFTLADVAELEEQFTAHVDGLVLGREPVARRLLEPALESDEPERIATAALALLRSEEPFGPASVLAALPSAPIPALLPLQRALELAPSSASLAGLPSLLKQEGVSPELLPLVLEVLGSQGLATAEVCLPFVAHSNPQVAAAGLRAASHSRLPIAPSVVQRALDADTHLLRDAAIVAGLQGGHRGAWAACQAAAEPGGSGGRLPLLLLAMNGDDRDLKLLLARLSGEKSRPDALWALGFSGRVAAADACVEHMRHEPTAALAGEAFSAITGLPIEADFAVPKEEPEEGLAPLEEEDLDANLNLKPEDALPIPNSEKVMAWWHDIRPRLDAKQRYLAGTPFTPQALLDGLVNMPMRRRHALALELALRSRGAIQVPTRRWVATQVLTWTEARTAPTSLYSRPFAEGLRG